MSRAAYLREWRKRNLERERARDREKMREWRAKNPERDRANSTRWRAANRDRINSLKRARRKRLGYTEQDRQEKRRYYARHGQELRKKMMDHYRRIRRNPQRYAAYRKVQRANLLRWRRAHPKETLAAVQRYIRKHPEKMRQRYHARYIRKMGWKVRGSHTVAQWLARCVFYGWKCVYCGTPLTRKTVTKDHRMPLSKGGTNFASNLVPACRSCNSRKGNR